ncbi:MAG: hypothetical protein BMS9Abin12_0136 [Acidimicrobiia bacterium]|nr:MAG: hypothetical protein BMS9Abin12_0136 [Acidimicrobiia bacterium]
MVTLPVVTIAAIAIMFGSSTRALAAGVVLSALVLHPLLAVALVASAFLVFQYRRIREAHRQARRTAENGLAAVELVGLGVSAGLPFRNAAALTAEQIDGSISGEIRSALRSVSTGRRPRLESSDLRSMFSVAAASEHSGMPLAGPLNALARDRRRASAAAARERLSKLPVKMLFPLAFLILPGFVMLAVVPPLMSGLSKLGL